MRTRAMRFARSPRSHQTPRYCGPSSMAIPWRAVIWRPVVPTGHCSATVLCLLQMLAGDGLDPMRPRT